MFTPFVAQDIAEDVKRGKNKHGVCKRPHSGNYADTVKAALSLKARWRQDLRIDLQEF